MTDIGNVISMPTGRKLDEMLNNNNVNLKKFFGRFDINGLELTMAHKERLKQFKLSKEDVKWIKDLDYVSIHSPFRLVSKSKDKKDLIEQLDALDNLYSMLNAQTLVVHVHECPDEEVLDKYNFNIALENMPLKEHLDTEKMFEKIRDSKYGFCLDTSHAHDYGTDEIKRLYFALKDKLRQVHLSYSIKANHHLPLGGSDDAFIDAIRPILKSDVPLVLEIDYPSFEKSVVNKDIAFVRNLIRNNK